MPLSYGFLPAYGGGGVLSSVRISKTGAALCTLRAHFFGSGTASVATNGDGALFDVTDALTWLGYIDVVIDTAFSDGPPV